MGHTRKRARLVEDGADSSSTKSTVENVLAMVKGKESSLHELYSSSVDAKIWKIASSQLYRVS